jgi:hypothetical protein
MKLTPSGNLANIEKDRHAIRNLSLGLVFVGLSMGGGVRLLGSHSDAQSEGCRGRALPVSGSISANVVTNPAVSSGLALGTVTGSLAGAVMATFTATPAGDGSLSLALHHNIVTNGRNSLATQDTGTLVPVPGLNNVFRMSVNYTITGGTGKFSGATGWLKNHGEADLNTGLLTLAYSGQVCRAEDQGPK